MLRYRHLIRSVFVLVLWGGSVRAGAQVEVAIDPAGAWSERCSGSSAERWWLEPDGHELRVRIDDPGLMLTLAVPSVLAIDPQVTPLLEITYRATGLRTEGKSRSMAIFRGGAKSTVARVNDFVLDGAEHTLVVDLRQQAALMKNLAKHPDALDRFELRLHAATDGTPTSFDLIGLRFVGDDPDTRWAPDPAAGQAREVLVTDIEGKPLAGVDVTPDPHLLGMKHAAVTGPDGRATLAASPDAGTHRGRALRVAAQGFTTVWLADVRGAEEGPLAVKLAPVTPRSGRAVDEAGAPVAGARGELWLGHNAVRRLRPDAKLRPVTWPRRVTVWTDADGRWTSPPVLATDDADVQVRWRDSRYLEDQWGGHHSRTLPQAALLDGTAESVLQAGVALAGRVTDEAGEPIAGAWVAQGNDRFPSNAPPAMRTDADGRYAFGNLVPGPLVLTVTAQGRAPELVQTDAAVGMQPLDFALGPPSVYRFRVVDSAANPVKGAGISADTWRGLRTIPGGPKTDANGEATWEGPADAVQFDVYAKDQMRVSVTLGPSDADDAADVHVVTMPDPLAVTLEVVDAATGEPVEAFGVEQGIGWKADDTPNWQHRRPLPAGKDGLWEQTFTHDYPFYAFRVQAEGHAPAATELLASDAGATVLKVALTKAEVARGRVTDATGDAVSGAEVFVHTGRMPFRIEEGRPARHADVAPGIATSADGTFGFTRPDEAHLLVVLSPAGYAEVDGDTFAAGADAIVLTPWATVSGVAWDGDRPAAGAQLMGHRQVPHRGDQPQTHFGFDLPCGAGGEFGSERVPAGPLSLGRRIEVSPQSWTSARSQTIAVKAGESHVVRIGGTGRPVTGRFVWPDDADPRPLTNGSHGITTYREPVDMQALMKELLPEGFMDWEPERRIAWVATDEGVAMQEKINTAANGDPAQRVHVNFAVDADGGFTTVGIDPGEYQLSLTAFTLPEGQAWGYGEPIAKHQLRFTVPPLPEGETYAGEPLDLGDLTVTPVTPTPQVGEAAPAFEAALLNLSAEGEPLSDAPAFSLADQTGKLVLIDFWATWCGPCLEETPTLKAVWNRFGNDPRFAMVGLSLDNEPAAPAKYARENELGWTSAYLGPWNQTQVPAAFGVQGIPSLWLIGPDGKVLEKNLLGAAIAPAVERALAGLPKAAD